MGNIDRKGWRQYRFLHLRCAWLPPADGATSWAMSCHSIGNCACATTAAHAVRSAAAQQGRRVPVASVYVLRGCVGQAAHPEGKRDSMLAAQAGKVSNMSIGSHLTGGAMQ